MEAQKQVHPLLSKFLFWLGSITGTIVLIVAIWGLILVREYIPIVGMIIVFAVPIVVIVAVAFLIAKGISLLLDYKSTEIGPSGNVFSRFGKLTMVHPLGIKEYRVKELQQARENEKVEVPSMVSLLRDGLIGGIELLLGYRLDGTPRYGLWDDLRTFIVAGKSRSGKTVTMVFFILQALLSGARVYICDIHARKKDGLLKVLEPVIPWLYVASTPEEGIELAKAFSEEMQNRERGISENKTPCLFVVDEWTKLLRDMAPYEAETMVDVFLNCAESWAGFYGYALIAGHEWTARESGGKRGTALRKNTHAAFVHRLDTEYAKFLLAGNKGKKAAHNTPNLPRGHGYLQDSGGELEYLIIPYYGSHFEAIKEVAMALSPVQNEQEVATTEYPALPPLVSPAMLPVNTENTAVDGKQDAETPVNKPVERAYGMYTEGYHGVPALYPQTDGNMPVNSSNVNAVNGKLTDSQIKELIERMHNRGIALRDIAYTVSLYGRNYGKFKEFCNELNLQVQEETV